MLFRGGDGGVPLQGLEFSFDYSTMSYPPVLCGLLIWPL